MAQDAETKTREAAELKKQVRTVSVVMKGEEEGGFHSAHSLFLSCSIAKT